MKDIFVVGTGTMSLGITQVLLEADLKVTVFSLSEELRNVFLEKLKRILLEKAKYPKELVDKMLTNLKITLSLEDAKYKELVIEAIIENTEVKKEVFKKLDKICDRETIFATNTSSLSITNLSSATSRSERFIGMHFFNPVSLMKLVEIIKGIGTSEETKEKIEGFVGNIGKEVVHVEETPGFIVNRILIPMINEAICLLENKSANVESIDKAMMLGANHPIGPLALSDLIGNDVVLNIMETLYEETRDSKYRPSYLLKKYVRSNMLGRKTKQGFYRY